MQPLNFRDFDVADGRDVHGPATLIVHINAPLIPLALWNLGRSFVRDKYIVGYWAWELSKVPTEWRQGLSFVHEIWVPSKFTAKALQSIATNTPVRVVPHPVAIRRQKPVPRRRIDGRPFTVLINFNMGSSFARKNPVAAIAAFRLAFGDDVTTRLIVKTSNTSTFPSGMGSVRDAIGTAPNIVLIDRTIGVPEIESLYDESDVVLSLHRSEGFGLILAEAMLRSIPVIATDWSGNVDFLNAENGIPIPYRLIAAEDPQGTYHYPGMLWADADIEAAAAALRLMCQEPELRQRLGRTGATWAARAWSAESYAATARRHFAL